jgi:GrpB-like predicted nucleotidyltransferase (UPF0157 family)
LPPPFKVELCPYDPQWAENAAKEGNALALAIGPPLLTIHHVGSTSIPGIHAKPILDLMPVVSSLSELDGQKSNVIALGYEWWGEFGLPGRRYCTRSDPRTGRRLIQLHCYAEGSPETIRHLAFRDYLRARSEIASAYDREKARCQGLYPDDSYAYGDCKSAWIARIEAEALSYYKRVFGPA